MERRFLTVFKEILSLALPVIGSQFGMVLLLLIDSLMIGRLGARPLAAVGVGSTLFLSFSLFGAGCLLTVEAVSGWSKDNKEQSDTWFTSATVMTCLLSILLICAQEFFCTVLHLFLDKRDLLADIKIYLLSIKWCLLPYFGFFFLRQFLAGRKLVKVPALIILSAIPLNILFNWFFIFGRAGFPVMGVKGAAYATVATRIYMLIAVSLFIFCKCRDIYPDKWRWEQSNFSKLIKFALPAGSQFVLRSLVFSLAGVWVAGFGIEQAAVHSVSLNLASFLYMVPMALSTAVAVLQARNLEQGPEQRSFLVFVCLASFIPFMILVGFGFYFFHKSLILAFLPNGDISDYGWQLAGSIFILFPLYQWADNLQAVSVGALRGLGETKSALIWHLVAFWLVGLPLSYYFGYPAAHGTLGIWWGLTLGAVMAGIGLYFSWRTFNLRFGAKDA